MVTVTRNRFLIGLATDFLVLGISAVIGFSFGWAGPAFLFFYVVGSVWVPIIREFGTLPFDEIRQRIAEAERRRTQGLTGSQDTDDPRSYRDKALERFLMFALLSPLVFVIVGLPVFLLYFAHGLDCSTTFSYSVVDYAVLPIHIFVDLLEEKYDVSLGSVDI